MPEEIKQVPVAERPVCPITKQECSRFVPCDYREDSALGNTMCAEWILKQRTEGRKDLESGKKTSREGK